MLLMDVFSLTEDGEITDTELRDVVLNFLIAGRDTTANVRSLC